MRILFEGCYWNTLDERNSTKTNWKVSHIKVQAGDAVVKVYETTNEVRNGYHNICPQEVYVHNDSLCLRKPTFIEVW